jgi:hypothetical protein
MQAAIASRLAFNLLHAATLEKFHALNNAFPIISGR